MAPWKLPAEWSCWMTSLACVLDARVEWRLQPMFVGLLFARGRRTITSWLRAIGVRCDHQEYYYFLGSLGRKCTSVADRLWSVILRELPLGPRVLAALDDTPTKRYGPHVEGAGIHHNPTPGPAGAKFLYGHNWVTLAVVVRHPRWGAIALPLLARLYVRAKNVPLLRALYRWKFRTKLELAAELAEWLARRLKYAGKSLWIVVDGAYAKRPLLRRMAKAGVVVVSRLRKDAALYTLPDAPPRGARRRGRPRKYGAQRISLAKRAAHAGGWQCQTFSLYGREETKRFKTFLATYPPAGGLIKVVLVKNDDGTWVAYFTTDSSASVAEILEAVADRSAIEQVFHDVKEVHGAAQPQLRHVWAIVAAWHMALWLYTLVEVWAWKLPAADVCDRSASPWDDPKRRPSHADRCKALRHTCLKHEFSHYAAATAGTRKIRARLERLIASVA